MTTITTSTTQPPIGRSTTGRSTTGRSTTGRPTTAAAGASSAVPWSTVLPLAVVLSVADGFWTIALRTAVGSIDRTTAPAASWLRESLLLLPLFVLAVLAALTLAQRWFGARPRGLGAIGRVLLTVVGLGSLAGAGVLAASAGYDYRLQIEQMPMLDMMKDSCSTTCQGAQLHATLGLQVRAVVVGTLIILVTNLLLVGWVTALRGGRLRLTAARPEHSGRGVLGRFERVTAILAAGLVGSATIHAAVLPEHFAEWTAAGMFFVLLTLVELGLAGAVLLRRRPLVLLACATASAGPLLLWTYSRTLGMPFGPEPGLPEPVGLADLAACALEILTLLVALALLRRGATERPVGTSTNLCRLALVAVVAVAALGVGGSSISWLTIAAADNGSTVMSTP